MSEDNLGTKQIIIFHKCSIKNERYDLAITPPKKTIRHIRSKRQKQKKTIIAKQKQKINRINSKTRNAVLESDITTIEDFQNLKDSIDKINPLN